MEIFTPHTIMLYNHITLEHRIEIQNCLYHGMSFKDIAEKIAKDKTTVSREVKRHITVKPTSTIKRDKDGNAIAEPCKFLLKPPFVCNPCKLCHRACAYDKYLYLAVNADKAYRDTLKNSREGIPLASERFYENDKTISNGIKQGQHLYHILQTNNLGVCKSTVYNHLKRGYLSVASIDFPRVVKFKPRKTGYMPYVPTSAKIGKTFDDFLLFKENSGLTTWVEMDTLIGRNGGKVILTFDFVFCNFMLGILLPDKSAASVSNAIRNLKESLSACGIRFGLLFAVILTDNGGEFSNAADIENGLDGKPETKLFFCDPARSSQKPHVEKNHTLFRDIVPQGSSFDGFTQETVNLIFSHVNAVKRKALNGKSPFDLFAFTYGEQAAHVLAIDFIPADRVVQSPKLLKI
jgi:IS30 family transposase